jgi:Amt family ammonium transporter
LAGLVGITANCDTVTNGSAFIIGGIAGVLVIAGTIFLEKMKLDDVVGAWPVHGVCGIWGGLATGIFGIDKAFFPQLVGSIVVPLWAFVTCLAIFYALKAMGILRVSMEEEIEGLDLTEHGAVNYPEFGSGVINARATDSGVLPVR